MGKEVFEMWYWIAAFFVSFIVLEESIYYGWDRYVFGKKQPKIRKWLGTLALWFKGWRTRKEKDVQL